MKKSYIFLAEGFEEIEALATFDILTRAGIDVDTVSIDSQCVVTGAHGITVYADETLADVDTSDALWLILPGGMPGASNLAASDEFMIKLRDHADQSGLIAAICASPAVVLATAGLLAGHEATCYPGFEGEISAGGATPSSEGVVKSGNFLTGKGPGYTYQFALAIVKETLGDDAADKVAQGMLLK